MTGVNSTAGEIMIGENKIESEIVIELKEAGGVVIGVNETAGGMNVIMGLWTRT